MIIACRERDILKSDLMEFECCNEGSNGLGEVDTDDDENIFEAWIVRETARIKRDREVRDAMVQEKQEIERVRNMTDEERKEWERKIPKPNGAPKQKWKYMQ
nr:hypothetical protein [Tanacetum cinerariifolium]